MTFKELLTHKDFWNLLKSLEQLENPTSLRSFCEAHAVKPEFVREVVLILQKFNHALVVEAHQAGDMLVPPLHQTNVQLELSLCEWLALQASFPAISQHEHMAHYPYIARKLEDVESYYPEYDMYRALEEEEFKQGALGRLGESAVAFVRKLEEGIERGFVSILQWSTNKTSSVFPHKIVYLEGELCLIGEDVGDRCLVSYPIEGIEAVSLDMTKIYRPTYSALEVDDFILAMRVVSGSEERLVLKLKTYGDVDLNPPYHFLGNPYITTNAEGDVIWAASIEVCDDFYSWLHTLSGRVKIMDPPRVSEGYHDWVERQHQDFKKAS